MKINFWKILLMLSFSILVLGGCKEEYDDTAQAGKDFLAANKSNPGVIETSTGLQYKVDYDNPYGIHIRTGATKVYITWTVYFINGSKFKSTITEYQVLEALPVGLQELIRRMKIGSKFTAWLPASLAYGSDGLKDASGGYTVDPNTVLIYEIEILSEY